MSIFIFSYLLNQWQYAANLSINEGTWTNVYLQICGIFLPSTFLFWVTLPKNLAQVFRTHRSTFLQRNIFYSFCIFGVMKNSRKRKRKRVAQVGSGKRVFYDVVGYSFEYNSWDPFGVFILCMVVLIIMPKVCARFLHVRHFHVTCSRCKMLHFFTIGWQLKFILFIENCLWQFLC